MQTLQVIVLGCSKNTVDTEHLLSQVRDRYDIVPEGDVRPVDCLLIDTCGFIGDAKEQSVGTILAAAARKKAGEVGKLIVFGCLSERYGSELPELIPEVDLWFGAREPDPLVKALGCTPDPSRDHLRVRFDSHHPYAFLKISEGCDRRCSYCAIPLIRGPHRSVPMEVLVKEAEALAAEGVKELVLIAQDTTCYGLDIYRKRMLAELLRRLSAIEGIRRLRIHYSYPDDFPEDVLDEMASNPKVCRYLDLPLQHISDPVLRNMRRHIDGEAIRSIIRKMRQRVPGVVLRTTLIVGHPGEGRKEFRELLDFVEETRFDRLGAFEYSEEEGTYGAEHFEDSVTPRTKRSRLSRLMELQRGISLSANSARVGTETEVLVDDFVDGVFVCRSEFESPEVDGEILVKYDEAVFGGVEPYSFVGEFLRVRITGADEYDLVAELKTNDL